MWQWRASQIAAFPGTQTSACTVSIVKCSHCPPTYQRTEETAERDLQLFSTDIMMCSSWAMWACGTDLKQIIDFTGSPALPGLWLHNTSLSTLLSLAHILLICPFLHALLSKVQACTHTHTRICSLTRSSTNHLFEASLKCISCTRLRDEQHFFCPRYSASERVSAPVQTNLPDGQLEFVQWSTNFTSVSHSNEKMLVK